MRSPRGWVQANLFEFHAWLHWWFRQVAYHAGFYLVYNKKTGKWDDASLAVALLDQPFFGPVGAAPLTVEAKIQRCILNHPKFVLGDSFSTSDFREWVRTHFKKDGKAAALGEQKDARAPAEVVHET